MDAAVTVTGAPAESVTCAVPTQPVVGLVAVTVYTVVAVTEDAIGLGIFAALRNTEGDQEKFRPDVGEALSWLEPLKQIAEGFAVAEMLTAGKTFTPIVVADEQPSSVPVTP